MGEMVIKPQLKGRGGVKKESESYILLFFFSFLFPVVWSQWEKLIIDLHTYMNYKNAERLND